MPHGNSSLPCLCITNGVYFYSIVRFVNCVKPKSIIKYRNLHDQHHRLGGIAWREAEGTTGEAGRVRWQYLAGRLVQIFNYNSMTLTTCLLVVFVFITHSYVHTSIHKHV